MPTAPGKRRPKFSGSAPRQARSPGSSVIGGFLIVPGLIASTQMPIINAVGTSLAAVFAFGLTTALSYAVSGLVSWSLAAVFIVGGIAGGQGGCFAARRLATSSSALKVAFACLIFVVAVYMMIMSARHV